MAGKIKLGHDPRNRAQLSKLTSSGIGSGVISAPSVDIEAIAQSVMEKHKHSFEKLAKHDVIASMQEPIIKETTHTVLKETKTHDKLARRHSKLVKKKTEALVDGLCDDLNAQNEVIHALKTQIDALKLETKVCKCTKAEKPQEKQIVIQEKIVEVSKTDKKLVIGVAVSIILSILGLIIK